MGKPSSWQKVKVLASKQHAPKTKPPSNQADRRMFERPFGGKEGRTASPRKNVGKRVSPPLHLTMLRAGNPRKASEPLALFAQLQSRAPVTCRVKTHVRSVSRSVASTRSDL